ncbi:efflux RND transporter periplasmic adaptor subunit [Diaminobutyricibacter sp. McL0618]|uniref:efflux RND transporter periplasmic adaptor subunit n=1 Tax=Leifsonia sp. McL0618 TaxID=3415677 RepID=UPI003CF956CF
MRVRRLRAIPPWVLVTGTAVIVAAVTSAAWWGVGRLTATPVAASISRTVAVSDQALKETITGTGTLTPTVNDAVDFGAPGQVMTVAVQAGSKVTAGQVLGTVDTTEANAALLNAQANLAQAQAKLSTAEASGSATAAQIAADDSTVTLDQSNVQSAQAEAAATTLKSPIAGMVTAVNVAVGDVVSASSSSGSSGSGSSGSGSSGSGSGGLGSSGSGGSGSGGSGSGNSSASSSSSSADFTVVSTGSWQVSVDVPASSVGEIAVGNEVTLSTTENPSFFGTVSSIGLLPSSTTGAATYPVVVAVTGSPANLYDGVTATASIVYKQLPTALTVPASAIHRTGTQTTVTKVVGGKDVTTPVVVGQTVGQVTQITKGLSSGDQVAVTINIGALRGGTGTGTGTRGTGGFGGGGGFGGAGFGGGGFGGGGAVLGGTNGKG